MGKLKIKVGIIGCGTIGAEIAKACSGMLNDSVYLAALSDIDSNKVSALNKLLNGKAEIVSIKDLIKKSDLVVEAASSKISAEILKSCISGKKNVLIMSVGGLVGNEELLKEAAEAGIKVYLPSGAICGIDGLKAASIGKINSVTITTRKPPKGLEGAPYLKENNISLNNIKSETIVFEGNAIDAVKGFPQNVNVCAVLSLAGLGAQDTKVKIVTSPEYIKNIHEVEIIGDFGRIFTRTENMPSKTNPKTSALAILSATATLKGIVSTARIGT